MKPVAMTATAKLERRIGAIKREIAALGPLRPGTLTQQYNVCGNPKCRCKADPPKKHGPYYQLSYTRRRKSKTHFVREEELANVREKVENYQRLRALLDEWVEAALEIDRLEREKHRGSTEKQGKPSAKLPRSHTRGSKR